MKLPIYQIDAFTSSIFEGNPAAVIPLDEWIEGKLMQKIAMENNLSETAFFVKKNDSYEIRWFTPQCEVDLCGHATLATSHLILYYLEPDKDQLTFHSKSGDLSIRKQDDRIAMHFPAEKGEPVSDYALLTEALGKKPVEVYASEDYMAVYATEKDIRELHPDFRKLKELDRRGVIVTAPGRHHDFVSRFFAPAVGIDEDPVTGSAHTMLVPYWAVRLGKNRLRAYQASSRGGSLCCTLKDDWVELSGNARLYMQGEITTK